MSEEETEGTPAPSVLTDAKLAAEVAKLRSETAQLRAEARHPWALKVLLTAVLTSLGAGAGGYFFGDSLRDRTRADVRKEVLETYFATDNNIPGKRKQILTFMQSTWAKDDPELAGWLKQETADVDQQLKDVDAEIAALKQKIDQTKKLPTAVCPGEMSATSKNAGAHVASGPAPKSDLALGGSSGTQVAPSTPVAGGDPSDETRLRQLQHIRTSL